MSTRVYLVGQFAITAASQVTGVVSAQLSDPQSEEVKEDLTEQQPEATQRVREVGDEQG